MVVKQVVSGADDLGRGRFVTTVANGRATIGPIEVDSPAGSARGTLVYEPRERDVLVDARVKVDRFDYGKLARRIRRSTDIDGAFSLDLRLAATAPRLAAALATGSGRFDFAVWPKRLQARVFDLWSANLLFRLLPLIDVSASPMNCMVGHFDLEHGTLRSRRLVIDTVNTRTDGSGTADFATSEVNLRFVPRAKVPQFFSLATPIEVERHLRGLPLRCAPGRRVRHGGAMGGLAGRGADPAARRRAHPGGRPRRLREPGALALRVCTPEADRFAGETTAQPARDVTAPGQWWITIAPTASSTRIDTLRRGVVAVIAA